MKKCIIFSLLLCFTFTGIVSAQNKGDKKDDKRDEKRKESFENFRAKRAAFITERVKLTPEEAQVFWPLCNELQEKKFELNKPLRENWKKLRDSKKEMTSEEYLKIIDMNADIKLKEAQLDKEYLEKFKKVLSPEKIFKYQRAEEEFMRQMFTPRNKEMHGHDKSRQVPGAPRPSDKPNK